MSEWRDDYYVNRTLCDVLNDMRKCSTTMNFAPLMSLIEEAQIYGNRMESGLSDKGDIKAMNKEWSELKNKLKELRKEVKEVEGEDSK